LEDQKFLLPTLDFSSVAIAPVSGLPDLELISAILFRDVFGLTVSKKFLDCGRLKVKAAAFPLRLATISQLISRREREHICVESPSRGM
jgi:hypothetical protein